jgi:hypothetical protein
MMKVTHLRTLPRAVTYLLLVLVLGACSQTKMVDHWMTSDPPADKPKKVAVIAALSDGLMREAVEIDMAKELSKKGIPAVAGSKLPELGGGIRGKINTEKAAEILKNDGVDGVIVSFYTGGGRSGPYVKSGYYTEYLGTGVGWGWAQPAFVNVYTVRHGEDPVDFQVQVWVETSYFDLDANQTVWRIITETKDIEHTDTAIDIANRAATQMAEAGLK